MMDWLKQSFVYAGIAVLCALATYLVHGEYDRRVPCVQSEMEEHEVCLSTVMDEWEGKVVWVDARALEEKEIKLSSALEITEAKADEDLSSEVALTTLFKAKGEGINIVVFCQTDGCGSSKFIREKIISSGVHDQVFYLHGGWKAIESDGRLLEGN
jgi:hypothetical protein